MTSHIFVSLKWGCVCFDWKWIWEKKLNPTTCLVAHGKFGQTKNHFIDRKIRSPQLENELHTRFTFKSFPDSDTRRERERARRESRASELEAHIILDRTTAPNPKLHQSCRTLVPAKSRCLKHCWDRTPAPSRSRCLKHCRDCTPTSARSHPWPTHAWSLSFSIYLSLSLNCRSLSLPPSLSLTEFLSLTNVLFWFLFLLSL